MINEKWEKILEEQRISFNMQKIKENEENL